jgi:hypothetical protein
VVRAGTPESEPTTLRFSRFDWLEIIDKNKARVNVVRDTGMEILSLALITASNKLWPVRTNLLDAVISARDI